MSYYIAEQTCHHPPVSAYFMANPENGIIICGNFKPKSKFLGNSVVSYMEGQSTINFLDFPEEEYIATNPNVYARGILVGPLYMELGDSVFLECPKTGFKAEILFKVKVHIDSIFVTLISRHLRDTSPVVIIVSKAKYLIRKMASTFIVYLGNGPIKYTYPRPTLMYRLFMLLIMLTTI